MSFLFRYLRFHDIIGGIHVPVDDGVDKLNRKYTLLVFLFLALPIFTKQYIGDPIECFAPVYFAEHQSRYINSYCWTQSTYYMVPVGDPDDDGDQQEPPDRITPDELDYFISFETVTHIGNERLRRVRVNYYQWAPLILLAQGLCFYIPFLIWNSCANNAGVKLRRLLKKASDIASLPPGCQQREALLAEFVDQFHTLVMGEAGWCADFQCGGAGGPGLGLGPAGAGAGSSGGSSSASNSSAGSAGGPGQGPGHHSHHHGHQTANGATSAARGAPGPPTRGGGGGGGGQGAEDAHQGGRSNSSHHHQPSSSSAAASGGGPGAGCCLGSVPILGSLIACCLRPCSSLGLGPSRYLCLLYLAVKFAYVFNVGLQFFLLGKFLGRGYLRHGLELINRIIQSGEWWASPRFPLSTLCQVRADMSGGLRSYTCQCVLPINVFNEKIFSVVWFYMAFLLPLNVLSLLYWIYRTFESNRMSYIRLCLWRTRLVELNQIHRTVRRLSQSYLGWDGVFLLRLIEHNHGSIMATLIMSRLWEFYANQIKLQEDANQLALATNAQHTLANLTTSTQAAITGHQHPGGGGGGGGGGQSHGPGAGGHNQLQHHHHHHHQQQQQQQQHQQHPHHHQHQYLTNQPHSHHVGPGHSHPQAHHPPPQPSQHSHAHAHHPGPGAGTGAAGLGAGHSHGLGHGPASHAHPLHGAHGGFAGAHGPGAHPPLQPTQASSFGSGGAGATGPGPGGTGPAPPPPPTMAPHGPSGQHGHHSGQMSQAPGHHPLHAANPAAATAHHVHHAALAAAAAGQPQQAGPQLSGAFTGAHANLLAQLHHQAAAANQQQQQQQQQAPGNVAAAVAALAAAAAAATSNQPGANNTNSSNGSGSSGSAQTSSTNASAGSSASSATGGAGAAPGPAPGQPGQTGSPASIHLQSLKQQQQQQQQQAAAAAGPPAQQQASAAANAGAASSATTSFITAGGGGGAASGGPPLPPPPPAHLVAAVAAAAGGVVAAAPAPRTGVGGPGALTAAAQSQRLAAARVATRAHT